MIAWSYYLRFVGARFALMLLPGPNVSLIIAWAVKRGPHAALMIVAGTSTAIGLSLSRLDAQ